MPVIKISDKDKLEIYRKYLDGVPVSEIAKEYQVTDRRVFQIINEMKKKEEYLETQLLESAAKRASPSTEKALQRMLQSVLIRNLTAELGEKITIGNIIVSRYQAEALAHGKTLVDYIEECVDFYQKYKRRVDVLEQEKEFYKILAAKTIYLMQILLNKEYKRKTTISQLLNLALQERDKEKFREVLREIVKIGVGDVDGK